MVYICAEQLNFVPSFQRKCFSFKTFRTMGLDEELRRQQKIEGTKFTLKTS